MAGIPISGLPPAPSLSTTDIFAMVHAGVTDKVTLQQISTFLSTSITGFVPISGGTMTGPLILSGDAILPLGAVTLEQLQLFMTGITVILAVQAATTVNLTAVYNNGAAGVGATLTNSGVQAAFVVDGYSANLNDRILVKNQTSTFQNGVYSVTTVGTGASNWVLTRTIDYDVAPSQIHPGTLVAVNNGTTQATTSWLETATVATIGTDPILFSQFTFAPAAFLLKANNLSDVQNVATSRTNLGLGTAATKAATDNTKPDVASVSGATIIGHVAVFADTSGTIEDGGSLSGSAGRLLNIQKFTTTGIYTPSAGANNALVKAWGAGGGGGANINNPFCAGAGGAGAYVEAFVPVTVPIGITIGAGGIGATANTTNNGTSGNDTSYGIIIIAKGGSFGNGGNGGVSGGLGGQASLCTVPAAGFAMSGGNGMSSNIVGGANDLGLGGSSANNTPFMYNVDPQNGLANSAQGGGGGTTAVNGGNGGSGFCLVYEYS
jgi:hypothetical protein